MFDPMNAYTPGLTLGTVQQQMQRLQMLSQADSRKQVKSVSPQLDSRLLNALIQGNVTEFFRGSMGR